MFRFLGSTISAVVLLGLAGCGDPNAGALYADIMYATRCDMVVGACMGATDHDICGFNRSDPCASERSEASISCTAIETDTTRSLTFSAQQEGSSISVRGLTVPKSGGAATGGGCNVTVRAGPNSFSGRCGGAPPSAEQPCQITDVEFVDDNGNPTFKGHIFCQFMQNDASPALQIEVTAEGAGPGPASEPGGFRIANCSGLTCTADTCTTPPMM